MDAARSHEALIRGCRGGDGRNFQFEEARLVERSGQFVISGSAVAATAPWVRLAPAEPGAKRLVFVYGSEAYASAYSGAVLCFEFEDMNLGGVLVFVLRLQLGAGGQANR